MASNHRIAGSKAIIYARVSTEEQAGENHFSIEAQINETREFAAKHGWEVVGEYIDEGISGTRRDRPQLQAVLDLVQQRAIDILLVHELSRLSRTVYDTLDIFELLGKNGIGFASVRDPDFDFADPSKRLFLTIIAAINEYYIVLLRQHTSKAKRERARQGLYNASITPYGYQHVEGPRNPPIMLEEEATAIRMAFEQYATGHFSDIEIAEMINQHGHKTRSGRRFSKDTVSGILTNPFYAGKVMYRNGEKGDIEIFDGQHDPLIPDNLWEVCQTWRESRRTLSRAIQKNYRVYLLSNLAVCDVCGRKLRAQGSRSATYYREMSYERGFIDCPHQRIGTRTEIVDRQIHELIRLIQLPQDWLDEASNRVGDDNETHELQRQRGRLEAERRRLQQMRLAGDFDDNLDFYRIELSRIRRQLNSLPTYDQIESLRTTAKAIKDLHDVWENADPIDQRDLLRLIINEISVDVPNGRVVTVSPLAIFLPIFRQIPTLHEIDFGTFALNWEPEPSENNSLPIPVLETPNYLSDSTYPLLPITNSFPLSPPQGSRNTPGISKALYMAKEMGHPASHVTQIEIPGWPILPMDTRKWMKSTTELINPDQLIKRSSKASDILVSQGLLWENAYCNSLMTDELINKVSKKLSACGIWYLIEPLPLDAPAHWLFRFFPAARDWYKTNTWTLHNLYMLFQRLGFSANFKRHNYNQSMTLGIIKTIAERRPGPLNRISEGAFENGLKTIAQQIDEHGDGHKVGSEFSLLEAWVQKGN